MRHVLVLLVWLSTFSVAQKVLAIAPDPIGAPSGFERDFAQDAQGALNEAAQPVPAPSSLGLLGAGLLGLTLAGGRKPRPAGEIA